MWLVGSIIAIVIVALAVFPGLFRLTKTLLLIVRVQPYEQVVTNAPKILVTGDSTAYGTGATAGKYSIAGQIGSDYPNYTIENKSQNGRTLKGLQTTLAEMEGEAVYRLVLLQIGGNDIIGKRPLEAIEADLRAVLTEANRLGEQVVLMTSGNVGAAPAFAKKGVPDKEYEALTRKVRERAIEITAEYGVSYVDLFLEPEEDVFLEHPRKYIAFDGLHPNNAGYDFWYQSVASVIQPILK